MPVASSEAVKQALAAGRVTVVDPATGYHQSLYADCPSDHQPATVWRVVRGPGHEIVELTMRCPQCGTEFVAPPESLYLR